jgi:predicted DCC family thiol-disulfide oxidoreductase YuxK
VTSILSSLGKLVAQLKASPTAQIYFGSSPVTLGLTRVYLGALLLFDLARRVPDIDIWYTNAGLMPNHTMLWRPAALMGFSPFFSVSELYEARFFFALTAIVYVLFLIGFKTRLFHFLSMFGLVFLNCRVHYLTNGGEAAFSVLMLWTLFLPMGQWLSVDSFLNKMKFSKVKLNPETGVAQLEQHHQMPQLFKQPQVQFQWAMAGIVLQLAVIYLFNFLHKTGSGWSEGRVIHDVLHQDRIVTTLGLWLRPHVTPAMSQLFTAFSLRTEMILPLLLLLPLKSIWLRRVCVALGFSLHIGIALLLNLGVFSLAMLGLWMLLIPHEDAVKIWAFLNPKPKAGTLYFDSDCGVCTKCTQALLALDSTAPIKSAHVLKSSHTAAVEVQGVSADEVNESVLYVDAEAKRHWRAEAFYHSLKSMPLLFVFAPLCALPMADAWYRKFAANRHLFSSYVGWGTCGIARKESAFDDISSFSVWLNTFRTTLRNIALTVVSVGFVIQFLAQNWIVPQSIKPNPPFWVKVLVEYTHFYQGWGMFSESPRDDSTVIVRAKTIDGRLVDPLSERAARISPMDAKEIPHRLDHSEFFCDYLSKIASDGAYHPPLRDWILAYPVRTHNPQNEIVSFTVVRLSDVSPVMGQSNATDAQETVVMSFP